MTAEAVLPYEYVTIRMPDGRLLCETSIPELCEKDEGFPYCITCGVLLSLVEADWEKHVEGEKVHQMVWWCPEHGPEKG